MEGAVARTWHSPLSCILSRRGGPLVVACDSIAAAEPPQRVTPSRCACCTETRRCSSAEHVCVRANARQVERGRPPRAAAPPALPQLGALRAPRGPMPMTRRAVAGVGHRRHMHRRSGECEFSCVCVRTYAC